MNSETNAEMKYTLLSFYFGTLSEEQRLDVEREMIEDAEVLLDYLELKRKIEAAASVPSKASERVWKSLQPKLRKKSFWISISMGAAIAAGFAFFMYLQTGSESFELKKPSTNNVLFDSSAELPVSSGVL